MYSQGRIKFVEIDGDHLRFTDQDLENIFIPFLKGEINEKEKYGIVEKEVLDLER